MLFLAWALTPEAVLHSFGVTYYPAKWWALALPSWLCLAVVYAYVAYGRRASHLCSSPGLDIGLAA